MPIRRISAVGGAALALVLLTSTAALAAGTTVSVRVEGVKRTLLAPTVVHTHSGSITKGGAPAGACPASSAAGALDQATHHNWGGRYSSSVGGIFITRILGEKHVFSSRGFYWAIWVNNRFATAGVCDLKLHRGDQLLFAPYPGKGTVAPIGLSGPRRAKVGRPFKLKVVSYTPRGVAKPLAGAHVGRVVSNKRGIATVSAKHAGKLKLTASEAGFVRSAPITVRVSG